ncbi:MAG: protease pro-enzyme activation domain-containing protein [Rhodanobacteraceae bacterium]
MNENRSCKFNVLGARMVLFALLTASASSAVAADASQNAVTDRVISGVDVTQRVPLADSRAKWAAPSRDDGRVPNDLPLTHLALNLKRPAQRQAAFEQFLREQQDPASANYQHWLTPREVGERFGVSAHDLDATTEWLRAQGLRVDGISASRTRIRFSGRADAVAAAFATDLRYFSVGNEKRIGTASDAQVPAALADSIRGVTGLETMRFRPAAHMSTPQARALARATPQPAGTSCSGDVCEYVVFPADFDVIYNVGPVRDQNIDGTGQKIAVVGRSRVYEPDMRAFQQMSGLAVKYPVVIIPPDGVDPGPPLSTCEDTSSPTCGHPADQFGDQGEATLDVQRAGSVAPGATIDLIVSETANSVDGVYIAMDYAIDTNPVPAKILSISFTTCEADNSRGAAESVDDLFAQAVAEGISVFVASGDAGVAGCSSLDAPPTPNEPESTNLLCSSGYVTCVGGTQFTDTENPDTYWRRTNGANYLSARSYIPEGAWNEPQNSGGDSQLASTGGGASVYIPTPSWQVGNGVPAARQGRYTPDVSLLAATREGYFTCIAASDASCVPSGGIFHFIIAGGTSASAPSLAGITALLNDKVGSAQANLNPRLYALAANASNGVFHDVTVATSDVDGCSITVPSACNNSTPGPNGLGGGLQGYLVSAGYDRATGLGTVNVANLLAHWNASASVNLNQFGLTGSWYNPATGGQGVVMQVVPDLYGPGQGLLFGGWFTFGTTASAGQRWYSVQGTVSESAASATMPIYISTGGNFDAPPSVGVSEVGTATFAFSDCTHGSMNYSFTDGSGRSGTIPLTRLGGNVACTPTGDANNPPTDFYLSGTWFEPANGGQGFLFDIDPLQGTFFGAWYTYARNGQQIGGAASQRWFSLQGNVTAGVHTLDNLGIFVSSGGRFDDPATVTTTQVGTARITFPNCNAATLTYTFTSGDYAGQSGSISLQRTSPAPPACGF